MVKPRRIPLLAAALILAAAGSSAASNLAVRLGLWHLTNPDFTQSGGLQVNGQRNFFYAEAAYENRLARMLSLDISLGTLFRGTIRYETTTGSRFVGTANVLPMSLGFSLYPIPFATQVQPYFRAGGTIAIGNQNSGNFSGFDAAGNPVFNSKTRVAAGGFGAFGVQEKVAARISLLAEVAYHHLKFSGPVAGIANHSGYQILAGIVVHYK